MKRKLFAIAIIIMMIAACNASQIRVTMVGMNWENVIDYSFQTFTGHEVNRLNVDAGETINLEYDMVVEKGSLHIQVSDPDGEVVWEDDMTEDQSGEASILVKKSGRYVLRIEGDNAGGSIETHWSSE